MAYGAKYVVQFSDVYQDTTAQYIATIYKKDYTGTTLDLTSSGTPLVIETDRSANSSYRPIIGSIANLSLKLDYGVLYRFWENIDDTWNGIADKWDDTNTIFNLSEFLIADQDTFYIELTQKNILDTYDVKWKGWYTPSSDLTISEIEPISINLVFSDFALLKSAEFNVTTSEREVSFNAIDRISIKDLLVNSALSANLGYEIRINFPYDMYKVDGGLSPEGARQTLDLPYTSIYLLKNSLLSKLGDYKPYIQILTELCSQFGLMVYQRDGALYISSYDELVNENSRVYKRYNGTTGAYIADITETDSPIELNSDTFINLDRSQQIRLSLPYKSLDILSKAPITTNNINGYFTGYDLSRSILQNKVVGWSYAPDVLRDPEQDRSVYSYYNGVSGIEYRYGHKITPYSGQTTIDENRVVTMDSPLSVTAGDLLSVSTNINNDFYVVLDDPLSECFTRVYCSLTYTNLTGVTSFKYLKPDGTWTDTKTAANNLQNVDVKNVVVPENGVCGLTILSPWTSGTTGDEAIYVSWAVLQSYKGVVQDVDYKNATSKNYFDLAFNNREILELNALSTFFNYEIFEQYTIGKVDKGYSAIISNTFLDPYYDYIPDKNVFGNRYLQPSIGKAIQKNIGLINTSITGIYKSSFVPVGTKFSYTIDTFSEKNFILLDYKMDFKQAEQDSILYSCEFTDSDGIDFENRIINDK